MLKKQIQNLLIFLPLLFILLGNSSCESEECYDCDPPPLPTPPKKIHIEGYIDENDNWTGTSVAYCNRSSKDPNPEESLKSIDNLKVRKYEWNDKLIFERDIYYIDEDDKAKGQNQKKVIFLVHIFYPPGSLLKLFG